MLRNNATDDSLHTSFSDYLNTSRLHQTPPAALRGLCLVFQSVQMREIASSMAWSLSNAVTCTIGMYKNLCLLKVHDVQYETLVRSKKNPWEKND
jgi:hypothetical protein